MKLTVAISAYNAENTLQTFLRAVRAELPTDSEILVVDDGSSDRTDEIARVLSDRVVTHRQNIGLIQSRVTAARSALGQYVVFMDADETPEPNCFNILVNYLESHPDIDVVSGMLSKRTICGNFTSVYKNYYMYHSYKQVEKNSAALLGGLYAFRRFEYVEHDGTINFMGEDFAYCCQLVYAGRKVRVCKEAQIVHLHKFGFIELLIDHWNLSKELIQIFFRYKRIKAILLNSGSIGNVSTATTSSIMLVPFFWLAFIGHIVFGGASGWIAVVCFLLIFTLNFSLINFVRKEEGFLFSVQTLFMIYIDHFIRNLGIIHGTIIFILKSKTYE